MPSRGFVLVCVAIALITADLAIPGLQFGPEPPRMQRRANENAAIASLRSLAVAQAHCVLVTAIDADGDSLGEHAYLAELAGAVTARATAGMPLEPALLPSSFGTVSATGCVARSGYLFRVFLPGASVDGRTPGLPEAPGGGAADGAPPDPDLAERLWCAYAWPSDAGTTGQRAFFVGQDGALLETANTDGTYDGEAHAPAFDAALESASPGDLAAPLGLDASNDGRVWSPVGS